MLSYRTNENVTPKYAIVPTLIKIGPVWSLEHRIDNRHKPFATVYSRKISKHDSKK